MPFELKHRLRRLARRWVRRVPYIKRLIHERDRAVRDAALAKGEALRAWAAAGIADRYQGTIEYLCAFDLTRANPDDVLLWLDMANIDYVKSRMTADGREMIDNHALNRGDGSMERMAKEIGETLADTLAAAAGKMDDPADIKAVCALVEDVAVHIFRWADVFRCRDAHRGYFPYFKDAEAEMPWQWENFIAPVIRDYDVSHVLDLACGHGRNSNFLRRTAKHISLVDVNQSCIDACLKRFGEERDGCRFSYYVNSGCDLAEIDDSSISLLFCWDAMIFFDKLVVRDYVAEFARVLKPGGRAFLHHSAIGDAYPNSDRNHNPASRSDMSASIMRSFAQANGLHVIYQRETGPVYPPKPGRFEDWWPENLDCISVLEKGLGAETRSSCG